MTEAGRMAVSCLSVGATLGEGPVWDAGRSALWFVDIVGACIHRLTPATGWHDVWNAPGKPGWILPAVDGSLIVGIERSLQRFDPVTGVFTLSRTIEPALADNRINDGTVGADGAIWFGTMDDREEQASGRFYRYDGHVVHDIGLAPVCISNGPAVSPDGRALYTVDTLARTVHVHDIEHGVPGAPRIFARIEPVDGYPDGVSCDEAGGLWLGLWGGWRARRYDRQGNISDEIDFPVANVTKVALGGDEGRTAYATTARKGLDPAALAGQPLAGDVFSFAVDIGAPPSRSFTA